VKKQREAEEKAKKLARDRLEYQNSLKEAQLRQQNPTPSYDDGQSQEATRRSNRERRNPNSMDSSDSDSDDNSNSKNNNNGNGNGNSNNQQQQQIDHNNSNFEGNSAIGRGQLADIKSQNLLAADSTTFSKSGVATISATVLDEHEGMDEDSLREHEEVTKVSERIGSERSERASFEEDY